MGRQFIELSSTTGGVESLDNLWLLEIDGDKKGQYSDDPPYNPLIDNPGTVVTAINLTGYSTGANGLFLWRDSATVLDTSRYAGVQGPDPATVVYVRDVFPGMVDLGYEGDEYGGTKICEDDVVTFLLVEGFTGTVPTGKGAGQVGDDLDAVGNESWGGDGIFDYTPWTRVLDAVGYKEPASAGYIYADSVGGVDHQGPFGADVFSYDPVEDMWTFFDSGSGEDNSAYVGPFYANDGSGWYAGGDPNSVDACFEDEPADCGGFRHQIPLHIAGRGKHLRRRRIIFRRHQS